MPNPVFFPYVDNTSFEDPTSFRLDDLADDVDIRRLYSLMIRPTFLPVGMSTSNRVNKPGYKSYQPVIAARQFSLGQVSPFFFLHSLAQSRADLPDSITAYHCYHMFDELVLPISSDLVFTTSSDDFGAWWGM